MGKRIYLKKKQFFIKTIEIIIFLKIKRIAIRYLGVLILYIYFKWERLVYSMNGIKKNVVIFFYNDCCKTLVWRCDHSCKFNLELIQSKDIITLLIWRLD